MIILVVAALFASRECAAQPQTNSTKTLVLGVIFQGAPQPVEAHFRPLIEYVAHGFPSKAKTKGTILVAPSAGQMIKLLEEKRVDFYMESPYPTYLINRLGAANDVANCCLFLASDMSSYLTGVTLDVNGGMLIH